MFILVELEYVAINERWSKSVNPVIATKMPILKIDNFNQINHSGKK